MKSGYSSRREPCSLGVTPRLAGLVMPKGDTLAKANTRYGLTAAREILSRVPALDQTLACSQGSYLYVLARGHSLERDDLPLVPPTSSHSQVSANLVVGFVRRRPKLKHVPLVSSWGQGHGVGECPLLSRMEKPLETKSERKERKREEREE